MKAQRIVIAGTGEMGHGLAIVHVQSGAEVVLYDQDPAIAHAALQIIQNKLTFLAEHKLLQESPEALLQRITVSKDLADALRCADMLIESIFEDPAIKRDFYTFASRHLPAHALLLSNTSALNVFSLAEQPLLSRLYVAHHFSPPYLLPLVEIVAPSEGDPSTIEALKTYFERIGSIPVVLQQYTDGFIVNKLQHAMAQVIYKLLESNIATARDIDTAVKASMGLRVPVLGVVQRLDFAGLGLVHANICNNGKTPPKILHDLVQKNHLGVKTQKGFYDYSGKTEAEIVRLRDENLVKAREILLHIKAV